MSSRFSGSKHLKNSGPTRPPEPTRSAPLSLKMVFSYSRNPNPSFHFPKCLFVSSPSSLSFRRHHFPMSWEMVLLPRLSHHPHYIYSSHGCGTISVPQRMAMMRIGSAVRPGSFFGCMVYGRDVDNLWPMSPRFSGPKHLDGFGSTLLPDSTRSTPLFLKRVFSSSKNPNPSFSFPKYLLVSFPFFSWFSPPPFSHVVGNGSSPPIISPSPLYIFFPWLW
ncbi:hypothetical protein Salat_0149700 [Sesamum alatum]|uniref:Uncharacterized protein n=1 Tax=Sesamum alatum TaxID=300844 RepID=A0AAE2CXL4_9LAMI|nr:hypothetical protein Salat_0149700 [Sesamum alatum]